MPPASPDPACARSLSACGVPCRGGATARSARTGSGIQCRIPPRSTRPPRGSCVAASRRSRLSACPVAPPSAGSYRLHGRSWPAPRSRRPDTVGTRAGLCRRPATTLQRSPDSSVRCPAAPERWHGGPGDARRNRRGPDQSGRVAIRCPGSQGGSWMKQNRLNGRWQGDFSDFRRVGVYSEPKLATIRLMTIDSLNLSRLDLIKIDVERMELEVLQGAKATLERFRPIVIVEQLKASKDEITAVLASYGYEWFALGLNFLAVHPSDPTRQAINVAQPGAAGAT